MKGRFGKRIGMGAMVLLVTVCFLPAVTGAFGPGQGRQGRGDDWPGHHRPGMGIWRNPQLVQELGLSDEQVKQIRETDFALREKQLPLKAQLDSLRLQMEKAFSEDTIDKDAVLALAGKMKEARGAMFVQRIESRLALGDVLNAEQIEKLRQHARGQGRQGFKAGRKHLSERRSAAEPCQKARY
jgi:Spy/CpxP family protein refolding chaperone